MNKVICVLVLYHPDLDILQNAVDSIINQVDLLFVSDNTPNVNHQTKELLASFTEKIHYVRMGRNVGIARAQNAGIKYAIENNFEYVYFLDQDSISPIGIVDGLKRKCKELLNNGINVGGCGPQPYNRDTGKAYIPNIDKGRRIQNDVIEVSDLISSASLFRIDLFRTVGLMEDALFIDFVDNEICWRAYKQSGFRFFKITSLFLSHKLGEGDRQFCGVTVKISKPFRTYFQYRNFFYLLGKKYVPFYWKWSKGIKYTGKFFYYIIFCNPRIEYFNRIRKGTFDGIKACFYGLQEIE